MLYEPGEVVVGQIVHLFPHTKSASRNVHRLLTVTIGKDPKAHWPMVLVRWTEDNVDMWEMVHRDDIRKRKVALTTVAEKRDGDTITRGSGGTQQKWQRKLALPGKVENLPDQMELF